MNATLITGAAGGIGREFAKIYAAKGNDIIAVDLHQESLNELKDELVSFNRSIEIHLLPMDLSTPGASEALFNWCQEKQLVVESLINNVGFGLMGEHVDLDINRVENMLCVNNLLLTKLCVLFGKEMKQRRHGNILNVASLAAMSPAPFFSAYSASKAYTMAFSVGLARELGEYNVTVSCLCPGTTKTAFLDTAQTGLKSASGITRFVSAYMITPDLVAQAGVKALEAGKLVATPNKFLSIQGLFLRHLPISLVSWFVHKRTV